VCGRAWGNLWGVDRRAWELVRERAVPGTPPWAVVAAWAAVACVVPSAAWRTAVGVGVPLGWSDTQLASQGIPGQGTVYVLALSALSIAAAALTLGLVQRWGERWPVWAPVVGGTAVPVWLAAGLATAGGLVVGVIVVQSVVHWSDVSGFADRPQSGWALLMAACYAPAALWPVLLAATTVAYVRRRTRRPAGRLRAG